MRTVGKRLLLPFLVFTIAFGINAMAGEEETEPDVVQEQAVTMEEPEEKTTEAPVNEKQEETAEARIPTLEQEEEENEYHIYTGEESDEEKSVAEVKRDEEDLIETEYISGETPNLTVNKWYWADNKEDIETVNESNVEKLKEDGVIDEKEVEDGYTDIISITRNPNQIFTYAILKNGNYLPTAIVGLSDENKTILINIPEWVCEENVEDGLDLCTSYTNKIHMKAVFGKGTVINPNPQIIVRIIKSRE